MSIKKIAITDFIEQYSMHPIFDVRSEGEYKHAHIPGAISLPLFNNEERAVVGTAYKKEGKQKAIKLGLDYFSVKMRRMIEEVEHHTKKHPNKKIIVHCWRGGMRSAGVAWLLDLYGFEVYTIVGGYKAFRKWTLEQFEKEYKFYVLGGYTGSSKTELLKLLGENKQHVIDLEGLAHHKGSAFGSLGQLPQPSQEMFENKIALALYENAKQNINPIWVEDESQRIGGINIPNALWNTIRKSPLYFMDIPFEERLHFILKNYGVFDKEQLVNAIMRIQKRFGPLETKTAINFILEGDIKNAFNLLLKYYDKQYIKAMHNRENLNSLLHNISSNTIEPEVNIEMLLSYLKNNYGRKN
jgi:tRNA 2-selenouridine synthase